MRVLNYFEKEALREKWFFSLFKERGRGSYNWGRGSIYFKHLKLQTITSQNHRRKTFKQDDQMRNRVSYGVSQNLR